MSEGFTGFHPNERVATALVLEGNLGIRISDILALRPCDIVRDGDRYRLEIVEKKTGKHSEKELSVVTNELAELKWENYKNGAYGQQYIEGMVPLDVSECQERSLKYINKALVTLDVQKFCFHCKKICSYITTVGYVLLFLSLSLSPYIAVWLSSVDLNCITLWSLAFLYVSLELKDEMREWLFRFLHKRFTKKAKAKEEAKAE